MAKKFYDSRKKGIIPATVTRVSLTEDYFDELFNLLCHSVKITGLTKTESDFVVKTFFDSGRVGYDAGAGQWAKASGIGINDYNFPQSILFTTANGKTWTRAADYEPKSDGAYIIFANAQRCGLSQYIWKVAQILAQITMSIYQNVKVVSSPYIFATDSDDDVLTIKQIAEEKENGNSAIIVKRDVAELLRNYNFISGGELYADRLSQLFTELRNGLINRIGILTANTSKRERVQSAEVEATLGEALDSANVYIDSFNDYTEQYGLPFVMESNSTAIDLYADGKLDDDNDEENEEKEQNDNGNI